MKKALIVSNFDVFSNEHEKVVKEFLGKAQSVDIAIPTDTYAFHLSGTYPTWDFERRVNTLILALPGINPIINPINTNEELLELMQMNETVVVYTYEKGKFKENIKKKADGVKVFSMQRPKIRKKKFSTPQDIDPKENVVE